nr:ATP-binding protein [uncultured Desulfobulbus sp.]
MRTIFVRLLLSFFFTILLTGIISGLVMFSISRRSVDTFRQDFQQRLQNNIARSVGLMGQAAYIMRQHQGEAAFNDYVRELEGSMHTQIFLRIENQIYPTTPPLEPNILEELRHTDLERQIYIQDNGRELIVAKELHSLQGAPYQVIGVHRMGPPPGIKMPPPPQFEQQRGILVFLMGDKWVRLLVFLPVAGIICYLLARSFSAPLARLRRTSRQIAAGDLSARIGTSLGKPGNEIGDLARDFDHMAERMEGLVTGQKRLLSDISHELRSPLARLNLALELAKKRFNAENDDILARIGRESERLNALIGQLLSLTRSEAFVLDKDTPAVTLPELIREIADDVGFETSTQHKSIKVLDLEQLRVIGSLELLHQAIENVIRNGAYYTFAHTEVHVRLFSKTDTAQQQWAVIQVRDHGPGVPEDKIPNLKEPFFRVAEARDRNSGGTGLGLAIAHQVVQQHGGRIHIYNMTDQQGLVVEINLPAVPLRSETT